VEPRLEESTLKTLRGNLASLRLEVGRAAERAGRPQGVVAVVAVTKYVGPRVVRGLHALGLRDFGESTPQRLETMVEALADLTDARWHLVGHLQRNKVRRVLRHSRCVHSLDSERLLEEIAAQASRRGLPVPDLYVEINAGGEAQKTGLPPGRVRDLLRAARRLEASSGLAAPAGVAGRLPIIGLMAVAPLSENPEDSRPCFRRLRELRDELVGEGFLDAGAGLSMGMSGDFQVAVEEGATAIRVGSILFRGLQGLAEG